MSGLESAPSVHNAHTLTETAPRSGPVGEQPAHARLASQAAGTPRIMRCHGSDIDHEWPAPAEPSCHDPACRDRARARSRHQFVLRRRRCRRHARLGTAAVVKFPTSPPSAPHCLEVDRQTKADRDAPSSPTTSPRPTARSTPLGGAAYYGSAFGTAPGRSHRRPRLHPRSQGLLADRRRRQRVPVRGRPQRGRCRGQGAAGPGRGRRGDARRRGYWLVTSSRPGDGLRRRRELRLDHDTDQGPRRRDRGHHRRQGILDRLQHRRRLQLRRRHVLRLGKSRHPRSPDRRRWRRRPTAAGTGSPTRTGRCSASATLCTWRPSRR